jgi:hypothetical protein
VTGIGLAVSGRDVAAGLVFSLGALKPQLVVLVPVVFLLQRRLRGLVAFGAGVAALAAGSVALVGWNGVVSWAAALGSPLYTDQVTVGQSWKMASVPALVTALAAPAGHGTAVALGYAAAAVLLAVFATWVYRRPRARLWCWTTALLTTVVASPHVVLYDALLVVPPALFALEWVGTPVVRRATAVAFCLAWLTPLLHVVFGSAGGVLSWGQAPWVAVPIAVLWWQVGHAPQPPTSAREVASEHAEQVGRP